MKRKLSTIIDAAKENDLEHIQTLLTSGTDVNSINNEGETALMWASEKGHQKSVQLLLTHGADVNHQSNDGNTALLCASLKGSHEIVQLLLAHGADVNHQNQEGETALMSASQADAKTVQLLLDAGADVNHCNENKESALGWAFHKAHTEIMQILLNTGAKATFGNRGEYVQWNFAEAFVNIFKE